MRRKPKLLPDIHEYLETADTSKAVSARGLEDLVMKIRAKTALPPEICSALVANFFQEIRNSMLRGDIVCIRGLGQFLISSPQTRSNKKRVFAKFKAYRSLKKGMNAEP